MRKEVPLRCIISSTVFRGEVEVLTKENKKLAGKLLSANEEGIELEVKSKEKVEGKKSKQIIITKLLCLVMIKCFKC